MRKNSITLSIIAFFLTAFNTLSEAQCDITAIAYPMTVCAGDQVILTSSGSCGYLMNNHFNNNSIGSGWSSTAANPVFNNPCGPGPNGPYLWVGTTASSQRTLTTNNYDVSVGGCTLKWDMRYGRVQGQGPCEDPDAANEGVHMQYSTNNGSTWTDFPGPNIEPSGPNSINGPFFTSTYGSGGYWQPYSSQTQQNNSSLYYWHTYKCTVPPVASTTSTKFRWAQLANSSQGWDAWGIDEVGITCPNPLTHVQWSTGDTVFNPGQITLAPRPNNLGYDTCFIVHIWDTLNLNGAYDTVCIHVLPIPTADFTADTNICEYDSTLLHFIGSADSSAVFTWSLNGQNTYNRGSLDTLLPTGIYSTQLTINQGGCMATSAITTIHVNPKPLLSFSSDKFEGCAPLTPTFTNYSIPTNSTFTWNFGNGDTLINNSPTYTYNDAGTYTVTLSGITQQSCIDTLVLYNLIHVYPNPTANFLITPSVTNVDNPTVQFTDMSSNNVSSWYWNFGNGDSSTTQNPNYTYAADGKNYTVWLYVKTDKGCIDSTSLIVRIIVDKIEVPNVITPNGDGVNDVFTIKNIEAVESSTVLIFDRWGKKIFESHNYKNDWDGGNAADGTYFYVIKYSSFLKSYEKSGTLTILH